MYRAVVRYRTKPERGDENQRLIEKVFEELNDSDPGGLRYVSFRSGDGTNFTHVAFIDDVEANPLSHSEAFAEFQRELLDRCDEPPVAEEATIVGSYRFFPDVDGTDR